MLELITDNRTGFRLEIIVFTYNEQRRIPNILVCYGKRFDVVVLDGRSTDNTVELAIQAGATVFRRSDDAIGEDYFAQYVNDKSLSGLCFYLLCDEFIKPNDLALIEQELKKNSSAVRCSKAEWVYGRRMLTFNHIETRGFRKGYAQYDPEHLHENLAMASLPDAQMSAQLYDLHHLHIWSVSTSFGKIGLYSEIEIKQFKRSKHPVWRFTRRYIASLFGFPLIKIWREWHIGLPRAIFWVLFDLAELSIAILSWIEQSYLISSERQLELYSTFYTNQDRSGHTRS